MRYDKPLHDNALPAEFPFRSQLTSMVTGHPRGVFTNIAAHSNRSRCGAVSNVGGKLLGFRCSAVSNDTKADTAMTRQMR